MVMSIEIRDSPMELKYVSIWPNSKENILAHNIFDAALYYS